MYLKPCCLYVGGSEKKVSLEVTYVVIGQGVLKEVWHARVVPVVRLLQLDVAYGSRRWPQCE